VTLRSTLTIAFTLAGGAAGSVPAPPQEKPPVFAAGVELAAVDVTVVDANGRPVRDLEAADFTLTVDGKPRRVVTAEFVAQDGGEDASAVPPPPSHLSTNEGLFPGRLVLIVVDQGNVEMGGGREVVRAAGRLLDRLGPADRVGLLTLPGPDPREEFTADKERVRAALQRVVGRGRLRSRRLSLSEALAYVEDDDRELELSVGTLVARLDLHGKHEPAVEVRMDVARDVDGPSVREVPARLVNTPDPGRRIAEAVIPVDGLPPGDYVVRATVSLAGTPVGVATHRFHVTGR
jgi:hypothetical protein